LVQLVQDTTHRDDIVIRMRREHDDALIARKLAFPADLGNQRVEYLTIQRAWRSVLREQRAEVMLTIVVGVELEHRLAGLLAQPDHGLDLEIRRPLHLADCPRRLYAGQ